jgi:hypothetical protein
MISVAVKPVRFELKKEERKGLAFQPVLFI